MIIAHRIPALTERIRRAMLAATRTAHPADPDEAAGRAALGLKAGMLFF